MIRVGLGYDIHRLALGPRLVLAGVEIPSSMGLVGHSDADVVLHALMDAMLGAAAQGDIGHHFPPQDPQYHDVSSLQLLAHVRDLLRRVGMSVINVDVVVVAEQPQLSPYINQMRQRIAGVLDVASEVVSIKATTNEGVGPEGRNEAISARAVALVQTVA